MENSEGTLGGGPPNAEDQQRMAEQVQQAVNSAEAALAATNPAAPKAVKLEREDHLQYQLLGSRAQAADLKITMYRRELQHAEIEMAKLRHDIGQLLEQLTVKYGVDMRSNMVSEDGYLMPRPAEDRARLLGAQQG